MDALRLVIGAWCSSRGKRGGKGRTDRKGGKGRKGRKGRKDSEDPWNGMSTWLGSSQAHFWRMPCRISSVACRDDDSRHRSPLLPAKASHRRSSTSYGARQILSSG